MKKAKSKLKVGTDCSGIEAPIMALQLMKIPFSHEFCSDIDPHVIQSIQANYKPKKIYRDILTRDHSELPKLDLYVAGFPCQSFSTLGKRQGFHDSKQRGIIFFACYETIKATRPGVFILENVKGLINHDKGQTFQIILDHLNKLPYSIHYQVLNTKDYGIPQNRERIYIIGIKKDNSSVFQFPKPVPLNKTIRSVIDRQITAKKNPEYYQLTTHKQRLLSELVSSGKIDSLKNDWLVNLNVSSPARTGARKDICPCLLAGEGGNCIFFLTSLKRKLTAREYLRLQGFPDSFKQDVSEAKMYKQVGNAMSVNVLAHLYKEIYK